MKQFITFLFFQFFCLSSWATIIHVPGTQPTIQDGINAALNGDTVLVANGTYLENISFNGKRITVASNYIMDGDTNHINNTIIDGSQPSNPVNGSVVSFTSGEDTTSVLSGFTITGGSGTYHSGVDGYGGGGIYMLAGGKIIHNKITNNSIVSEKLSAGAGLLALAFNSYNIIITHNEFKYNSILCHQSGTGFGGGGIYCKWLPPNGYLRINNNRISDNTVTVSSEYKAIAGGLGLSMNLPCSVDAIVENNIISKNELHCTASVGGGIYVVYWDPGYIITDDYPSPVIRNNIIIDNYSEGLGAGIGVWTVEHGNHYPNSNIKPQPAIINNTIANNIAQDGCGIFNFDSYPLLLDNIFWDDLSTLGSNEVFDGHINFAPWVPPYHDPFNDGEVFVRYSDIQGGWPGEGNINSNPLFADTINYELSEDSPCIEAGTDSIEVDGIWYKSPKTCFLGHPRPSPPGTNPDMGACESFYTGIRQRNNTNLKTFILAQNYPNPFNPITTIEFELPNTSEVTLKVFNILGEEVTTLVSDRLSAGSYSYEWDASNLASGVYLYKLEAEGYVETRKMILMK